MTLDFLKVGLRTLLVLPLFALMPAGSGDGGRRVLYVIEAPATLPIAYGLGVIAVPDPPVFEIPAASVVAPTCPIEVRAIVVADDPSATFAVLAWGDESVVVNRGDSRRTPFGWLRVASIRSDRVLLRRGDLTFQCALGGGPGASTGGR